MPRRTHAIKCTCAQTHVPFTAQCAPCKAAAACYSAACKDGTMGTTGPFAACAGAKGTCDKCYPGSPCGAKPAGWTAPPTTPPTARPIQWREAPSPANRTACEEVENSKISYSTYGFLETCIAADRSGLCVHKQVADACPVHCGRCGSKPAAWGTLLAPFALPSLVDREPIFSVLCSNMCRPELDFHDRLREKGIWISFPL